MSVALEEVKSQDWTESPQEARIRLRGSRHFLTMVPPTDSSAAVVRLNGRRAARRREVDTGLRRVELLIVRPLHSDPKRKCHE